MTISKKARFVSALEYADSARTPLPLATIVPGVGHSAMLLYSSDLLPGEFGAVRLPEAWLGDSSSEEARELYIPQERGRSCKLEMAARGDTLYSSTAHQLSFGGVVLGVVAQLHFIDSKPPQELVSALMDTTEEHEIIAW